MNLILLIIGIAGLVFFLTRWMQMRSGYNAMSEVERRYAEVSATIDEKKAAESSLARRRSKIYAYMGLQDSVLPLLFVVAFGYLTVTSILIAIGVNAIGALLVALPAVVVIVVITMQVSANKRKDRFNVQMITLLDLLTAQLRSGVGTERALVAILPSLQEPMHSEIDRSLRAASSGGDLIANLTEMRMRYPSRALDMFLAALEIDRSEGHSIVPALEQASTIMKNAFTLQSEGRAELSSSKMEFYGVLAVVLGLTVQMVFSNLEAARTWLTPIGIIVLLFAAGLIVTGVALFTRIVNSLKKETE